MIFRVCSIISIAKYEVFYPYKDRIYNEFMISGSTFFPDHELENILSFAMKNFYRFPLKEKVQ